MARVIQLRRGTTAQQDNFTGMPGEVTYDTEAKTLRVHDGVTLGGYALARVDDADNVGTGDAFDINSVPDEFWANIVAKHAPVGIRVYESMECVVDNTAYIEYAWGGSSSALMAQAVLVCQTPEADYAVGDVVAAFGIGGRANPMPIIYQGRFGLHIRLGIGGDPFWVVHKTTGRTVNITNERWKIKFLIWY